MSANTSAKTTYASSKDTSTTVGRAHMVYLEQKLPCRADGVQTGERFVKWHALDHISPSFSYMCIDCADTSGDMMTKDTPWDFFHIDSISKNADIYYLTNA